MSNAGLSTWVSYPPCTKRIYQIECYNVGFGDCFLCKDDRENGAKMLVDCGTHRAFKNVAVTGDIYSKLINAQEKNLMISHLHQDHYNGITYLLKSHPNLKFDNVYLPNYISNGSLELYAAMVFYGKKNDSLSKIARTVLAIPGILASNLSRYAKIYFACEGEIIHNQLCSFETILPKKSLNLPHFINNEQIRAFCENYWKILNVNVSDSEYTITADQITQDNHIQQRIDDLIREYDMVEFPPILDDKLEVLRKAFEHHHNNMSLAFHEKSVCDNHNVLFLGDAEKANIKYACNKYARKYYNFVKIPHHGTKAHFYNYLPSAKYYAITNGDLHKSWEITSQYDTQYGKNATFICSNNVNCEICQRGGTCQSHTINGAICGIKLNSTIVDII